MCLELFTIAAPISIDSEITVKEWLERLSTAVIALHPQYATMWNHIVDRVVTRIVSPLAGHYSQVGRELRTQCNFAISNQLG